MSNGEPPKMSFTDLRDQVRNVLSLVTQYDVDWENTRFDRYLRAIENAAAQSYPRSASWERDQGAQRLFWEAANQTQQLTNSSTFWATQDRLIPAAQN
jgi:hypothetical protein